MHPELISVDQMYQADALTIKSGTSGYTLMRNAGSAVAEAVWNHSAPGRISVLCGPGNNGGDGFVAADVLADAISKSENDTWSLSVFLLGDLENLKGDAALAAHDWLKGANHVVHALDEFDPQQADIVVDALFGAGLSRAIDGKLAKTVEEINKDEERLSVFSVDVPSGIHGDTGATLGRAIKADNTVTFFRKKPGHIAYPGRRYCGLTNCVDIGIKDAACDTLGINTFENVPSLWSSDLPHENELSHKYTRGHVTIVSGDAQHTGAARLSAHAALRAGAGLVTLAGNFNAISTIATQVTAIMVHETDQPEALAQLLKDQRRNVVVMGPGLGIGGITRDLVRIARHAECATVLDADALTSFGNQPEGLFKVIDETAVLTPHEGEFARLFPDIAENSTSRLGAARAAAERSGAIVVLKGADTMVAHPEGRVAISSNATPNLATAGSGDVLAGLIGGLLGQSMSSWQAACAGVWLHGEAGRRFGIGLTADDLPDLVPEILQSVTLG